MSIITKAKKLSLVALNPHIITCKVKYLFIFGHMRSRSSVLSHVLGSNPNICGYSELHLSYLSYTNLMKMRIRLYQDLNCELQDKYLLDSILHNRFDLSDKIFETIKPKIIFLIRNPESTIKSIINMGDITGAEWVKDPNNALHYYCSRLAWIEKFAEKIPGDYFYIDSNNLVSNTEHVLETLSKWLKLKDPLDSHYSTFSDTGKPSHGDPSQNIFSGTIKKTKEHVNINVPSEVLDRGISCYERCKNILMTYQ